MRYPPTADSSSLIGKVGRLSIRSAWLRAMCSTLSDEIEQRLLDELRNEGVSRRAPAWRVPNAFLCTMG
jgi:hypothetical protein